MGVEEEKAAAASSLELEDLLLPGVWHKGSGTVTDYPIPLDPRGPFCWCPWGSIQVKQILSRARS